MVNNINLEWKCRMQRSEEKKNGDYQALGDGKPKKSILISVMKNKVLGNKIVSYLGHSAITVSKNTYSASNYHAAGYNFVIDTPTTTTRIQNDYLALKLTARCFVFAANRRSFTVRWGSLACMETSKCLEASSNFIWRGTSSTSDSDCPLVIEGLGQCVGMLACVLPATCLFVGAQCVVAPIAGICGLTAGALRDCSIFCCSLPDELAKLSPEEVREIYSKNDASKKSEAESLSEISLVSDKVHRV